MASFKAQITNQFSSITLPTTGFWRLKTQESGVVITASETQQGDVVISNFTGEGIIEAKANNQEVWVKSDQADGIQSNLIVENFFFDKVIAGGNSGGGGGGQPTTNLVFQSPLKKSSDSVSLTIAQNKGLTIDQDALTLDLAQNTEFTTLSNDLDSYKQSNDQTIDTIQQNLDNVDAKVKSLSDNTYTKQNIDDTFATKQSLEAVSNKADANETKIQQINTALQSKADANTVYTKVDADAKFATKQEVTNLGNSVLKTTGDQSANGVKTFLDGYKGTNKSTGQYVFADNVEQREKRITFNFTQPTSGYVNHSTIEANIKNGSSATAQRFFAVSAEGDLNQTYMYVLNNRLKFKSPTIIQNVFNAVDATDAINKGQFDNAFNPLNTKVTTLEGEIDTLKAKGQFVSIAAFTKAEAEQNSFAKLNEFVQQNTNPPRAPQIGDEVVTSDNFRFIYAKGNNGDTWVMEASQMPEVATAQRLGIVKFGTLEGEVEDKGGGVMQVKGYSTLKTLVESHTSEIQELTTELGEKAASQVVQQLQTQVNQNQQSTTRIQQDLEAVSNKADANEQAIQTINSTLNNKANSADVVKLNTGSAQTIQDSLIIQAVGKALSFKYSTDNAMSYVVFTKDGTTENFKLGKTTDVNDFYFIGSDNNSRWIFGQKAQYVNSSIQIDDDAQFIHKKYLNDNYYNKSTADRKYATQDIVNRDFLRKNADGTLNANITMAANKTITFRNTVKVGYGSDECRITSEDGTTKTLKFYGDGNNNFLILDLGNRGQLKGIKTPTQNDHATNKEYVDTATNACVKLNSNTAQTINSPIIISNTLSIGTYKFSAEADAVRFSPGDANKWVYFGDPDADSGGLYFAGLDFNERVVVQGIKDPTQETHAVNKRYVDQKFASVNPGNIAILDPNTTPSTTNIPNDSFVLIARR